MKPIFGIDITSDKNNEIVNGNEFITKNISKQKAEELESKQQNLIQTVEDSKLPLLIRIVKYICGLYAVIVISAIISNLPSTSFDQALRNAPLLIISGFVCGLIWLVLQFFAKRKEKLILTDKNADQQIENIDIDIQKIYDELNVPDLAVSCDVLSFKYKIKNNELSAKAVGFQTTAYFNLDLKIYKDGEYLCLADLENVYSFKLSEIKEIKTVNKRISVFSWNKEEAPTKGDFKKYKMTVNNMGNVFFKPYYILEIEHNDEIFGIYFPCYELPIFEKLTGLTAQKQID